MNDHVKIKVPFARELNCYNDVEDIANAINNSSDEPILDFVRIPHCNIHIGVFYIGLRPSNNRLVEIVKEDLDIDIDFDHGQDFYTKEYNTHIFKGVGSNSKINDAVVIETSHNHTRHDISTARDIAAGIIKLCDEIENVRIRLGEVVD